MFLFVVFSRCRIWRIRCTSLSRGDARCWRISTTPKATAKHQHPFLPTCPLSCLPFLPSHLSPLLLSCFSALIPTPPPLPPLFCFSELAHLLPPCCHSFLSLPVTLQGHRMTRLYPTHSHLSFSSSPHVLASEHHFPCGFTRWSFSLLIIEGKFWGLFMRRRARSHLFMSGLMVRHYHVQLPSTCYHARLSFSRRKLFWCWNITEKWTWNDGKDFVVDEGIMMGAIGIHFSLINDLIVWHVP